MDIAIESYLDGPPNTISSIPCKEWRIVGQWQLFNTSFSCQQGWDDNNCSVSTILKDGFGKNDNKNNNGSYLGGTSKANIALSDNNASSAILSSVTRAKTKVMTYTTSDDTTLDSKKTYN